ncbi:hypothetical protein BDN72DRAFT_862462 [Pluteus cervinus]|uniref:Uncharacterized protein n=1 Tax=Pluteus cervinus TaxID=181527 RepID=A0ACD3ABX7_9AGAR|nr:hypothetical protein BDN72DRAFT_862462 [Pluteus cervinus]
MITHSTPNATSPTPTFNEFEEESRRGIEEIDDEIQQLQTQIQILRSTRNQLTLISRILVTEILTSIFVLARDTSESPRGYMSLVISWVCRDWRQIALGYPILWNDIESTNMEWVQESLVRSGDTSLSVTVDRQKSGANTIVPFFLKSLPRMRSFAIQDVDNQTLPSGKRYTCSQDWNAPAPLLEELSLTQVNLSETIFSGGVPRLQSLSLSFCTPGWRDNLLSSSLVAFSLRFPQRRILISAMVEILRGMPNLQNLSLSRSMGQNPSTSEPNDIPYLQNLRTLSFAEEECTTTSMFLHHISIPSRARVSFSLYSEDNLEHVDAVEALQDSRKDPSSRWELTHLELLWGDSNWIWITETSPYGESTLLMLQFPTWLSDNIVTDVVQALDLSSLRSLECRGLPPGPYTLWSDIFGHLSKLNTLILRDNCVPHFLQHLEAEAKWLSSSNSEQINFTEEGMMEVDDEDGKKLLTFVALRKLLIQGLLSNPEDDEFTRLRKALEARLCGVGRLQELVLVGEELPDELTGLFVNGVERVSREPPPTRLRAEGDWAEGLDWQPVIIW